MRKVIVSQFIILLLGTLFAWTNFSLEIIAWIKKTNCPTGCAAGTVIVNPFLTPCFYGAIFFTISFILSAILFSKK